MNVSLHLSKLTFASGDTLSLAPDSIVLFVGPNSSGKTQSLKDLWNQLTSPNRFRGVSIVGATLDKTGDASQFLDFIRQNSITRNNKLIMSGLNISPPDAVNNDWKQEHPAHVGRVFAQFIEADARLSAIKERTRINRSEEKPIHPLQALDFDPDSERDTSNTFNNVFGQHLLLDRGAGSVVNLHVGTRPDPAAYGGEYSPDYASEVRKRPFAKLCGVCPIPAGSGKTSGRHRLNRGGNRQANAALYRVVVVRLRWHPPTIAYVKRRKVDGLSKKDIIRCLKRFVARELYHLLPEPSLPLEPTSTPSPT